MELKTGRLPVTIFCLACFGYFILMVSHISVAYLDFGDGNYLYISRRLLQGVVIYKDILSPQPPFHLILGALLLKLGDLLGNPLFLIRVFSILLRITHALLIYLIALKLFDKEHPIYSWTPALSGIIYLFLPIGFWWSRGYQSEPLEILWMLLSFLFFIQFEKKSMVIAGLLSSFAVLTNMTAAPYLVLSILYLVFAERKLLLWFLCPIIVSIGLSVMILQWYTSGMFLQNAIYDQVGTYPKEGTLNYMIGKIEWVGGIILSLEGLLIITSLGGLFFYFREIQKPKIQYYILIYMLATMGSLVYASKGGTVDYIFTLGEPAVALFSVYCVVSFCRQFVLFAVPLAVVLLILLSFPGIIQNSRTLRGLNYELPPERVNAVVNLIQKNAGPNDLIFAPPYFAFLANRPIVGEFSEQFVWFIKYINWILYQEGNPQTLPKLEQIGNEMASKKVKIILLNIERGRGQQTGQIGPFRKAVMENYHPIGQIPMRNETLTIFLPNP